MKESGKFDVNKHLENLKKTNERMGKLKALLKEYNNIIIGGNTRGDTRIEPRVTLDNLTSGGWCFNLEGHLVLISKEYGFIKWLVDNNKIRELDKLEYVYGIEMVRHGTEELYTPYSLYENLLMLLSIQDNPIEFLISILR